ncbi:MAG: protein TolQ [Erythrobacter sp.]|uniref:protein TolQ n=1 Tax=Erythrobacter sp. HL-111 TaxID=1798193 RepID=UPI0006D9A3A2|nr:protein TolQ [Erythrobacter sp. HL-111]KPP83397.1 MAG: TolA energization system membrane component TolQ [Erythrobacteraceae bacterium HL-111]SDS40968.1 Cell division and transport-associated protein TolQ [Erythrobacter sp. HL-111]
MPTPLLAAAAAAAGPTRLDPLELFLAADIVVQAVMIGLILASIWTWTIIVSFSLRTGRLESRSRDYEAEFWETRDREATLTKQQRREIPSARIAAAGLEEWRKSVSGGKIDADAARQRIAAAMESQVAFEADELAGRLGFLASTGSVAPFVGLFGTVWGIMNSFFQIGAQQSASLAVVAPGIAEALFATAIGLFAAIPAVIAYNRFSNKVNQYEARLQRFADRVHAGLSRELDKA